MLSHGGARASDYCSANLHKNIELEYQRLWEAFKSTKPGSLTSSTGSHTATVDLGETNSHVSLDLSTAEGIQQQQSLIQQSIHNAFLLTDQSFLATHPTHSLDGTTASIAILQPLFGSSSSSPSSSSSSPSSTSAISSSAPLSSPNPQLLLVIGHVGDSRILLCDNITGKAQQLTDEHHVSTSKEERDRIVRAGGFVTSDSFGEQTINGMLATSRSLGVARLKFANQGKGCGLIAEPFVSSRILDKNDAFLVLVTDGLTCVMSNQELVDIVKLCKDPTTAAITLIDIAERFGTHDNSTALVVRLNGWPLHSYPPGARDFTQNLRRYKLRNSMTTLRYGSQFDEFEDAEEEDDDDDTAAGKQATQDINLIDPQQYHELSMDRFLIDLFDISGKDIGNSEETEDVAASKRVRTIGRLTAKEILEGIQSLGIFLTSQDAHHHSNKPSSSEDGKSQQPATVLVGKIFETVGLNTEDGNDRKSRPSLSAIDIRKALQAHQIRAWKKREKSSSS